MWCCLVQDGKGLAVPAVWSDRVHCQCLHEAEQNPWCKGNNERTGGAGGPGQLISSSAALPDGVMNVLLWYCIEVEEEGSATSHSPA
jgi:hypothetical protein